MSENTENGRRPEGAEELVEKVRERYGRIAESGTAGCCSPAVGTAPASPGGAGARKVGYRDDEIESAPDGANLGLGCGAPIAHLELQEGETVLDLGSGGGFDAFLAAPRVGPTGRVIGVDMTPEMIRHAEENARRAGFSQVEFRQGRLEALPVEDASVDAVTSNCVINLVPDKSRVFREVARVLRPGGRLVVADILLDGPLPEAIERDLMAYVGCVAGAMRRESYFEVLREAGLSRVEVLSDVDFLATTACDLPEELRKPMEEAGVRAEELEGRVRSVTYRAVKP